MCAAASSPKRGTPPLVVNFATAGLGGIAGWVVVHPFNTVAVRMNLASSSGAPGVAAPSFFPFLRSTIQKNGVLNLYQGLSAGITRQIFYATSRFGIFEVLRDELAKHRPMDLWGRLLTGCVSGGIAAFISCPAEVTLVRISNDSTLPVEKRRNYSGVVNAFSRILREEGPRAFLSGSGPFVNRAMLVGAVQVGTYDEFRGLYRKSFGIVQELPNVFAAAMTSGLLYSVVTMPLETAKNRMAFQKPDPVTGIKPYTGALQTMRAVAAKEGVLGGLYTGFPPYYLRCGGHTVCMFVAVEWFRKVWAKIDPL